MSPCLFNLYAEYIEQNAGLVEEQAEIKIAGRNINNLRYADDTTLMAESEWELKSLLMKLKKRMKKLAKNKTYKKLRSCLPPRRLSFSQDSPHRDKEAGGWAAPRAGHSVKAPA